MAKAFQKNILLVEPQKGKKYHTPYPPLGLLKFGAYEKENGNIVKLVQGIKDIEFIPDKILITSLFTYSFEPVHEVIEFYRNKFKKAEIIVGGIYATLCKDHLLAKYMDSIRIREGLCNEVENLMPDYSLVPNWDSSLIFSSRGCIRKCNYCSVPKLEKKFLCLKSIKNFIYPKHKKIVLWDNNILASPYQENIFEELLESKLDIDFNQGLDARLINEKVAMKLKQLNIKTIRLAYDSIEVRDQLKGAIGLLKSVGFRGKSIIVYCLHNFIDTPNDFLCRIKDLMDWSVVAYPMRYEPLDPKPKNSYISSNWTCEQLEMVAKARRVIGFGGAFPPYDGLRKKILKAKNFESAFELKVYTKR